MFSISVLLLLTMSHVAAFATSSSARQVPAISNVLRMQYDAAQAITVPAAVKDIEPIYGFAMSPSAGVQTPPLIAKVPRIPHSPKNTKMIDTNFETWKRRLDTHEDPLNVHKWAGLGWMLSSAAIFGCGALSGFTEVPAIMEPITYLFLVSTFIQSLSSIPMAIKYRANEPSVRRGFISSAITSSSTAFVGFWLGPFGDHINSVAHLPNMPDIGMTVVTLLTLGDSLYFFYDAVNELDPSNISQPQKEKARTNTALDFSGLLMKVVMSGIPLNMAMLQQLWVHSSNARTDFLDILVSRGSSSDMVFYASIITSIAACMGNLSVTLHHRKLISSDVNNFAMISAIITTFAFNIRAAGIDVFQQLLS